VTELRLSRPTVAAPAVRRLARAVRPELALLLALAAVLNLWALSRNGWANDYYAAAVRSMASSVGAGELMAKVEQVGRATGVDGLYDLRGLADALAG
jgi:hypothetical protein